MSPFPPCRLGCGLIIMESRKPVPLRSIQVDVHVKIFVADVSATLKYKNTEEKAVEAIFVFPMDEDSAVYSFEATIEGKKIVADLQEKKQAHKTYDDAISQGQQAFLLEEDESSADIFSCSVGNLPPGEEAEVTLKYVRELPVEADGAVRFVLPAILNPRYTPKDQDVSVTVTRPHVPVGKIPYTLDLSAHFQSKYGISNIESNCKITPLQYTSEDKTGAKVSLVEGQKFERDVEFLVYYTEVNKPSVTVEAGLGSTCSAQESSSAPSGSIMADPAAMLNFYPSFPAEQEQSSCGEFIFLVDRSGSMECSMSSEPSAPQRIDSAKETLVLLLKSLPLGCYFNIYGFGSHFEAFFPESVEYTQSSMEEALKKVNAMDASFGGTEILQPLVKIYKTGVRAEHPRQLFVFTDGEVGNTKQVIAEVRKNADKHRCFTFGIGEGASTSLIKGMARAGSGTFEFITGKDRMQPKVLRALKYSLQPTVKDVSITWTLPAGMEATVLSKIPAAIFQCQRSIIYAQLKGKAEPGATGQVSLQYKFKEEIVKNDLPVSLDAQSPDRPTIHRLAAKTLISELEHGTESDTEAVKKQILDTSLQCGVISSLTAYVAVNKDTKKPVEGPPVRRDIPPPAFAMYSMPAMPVMSFGAGHRPMPRMMACSAPMRKMKMASAPMPDAMLGARFGSANANVSADSLSLGFSSAQWLDYYLQPYVRLLPSYLKDTGDFLQKFKEVEIQPEDLLVTMDISSLYTNIPNDHGIKAVKHFLTLNPPEIPVEYIVTGLEIVLHNNYFRFEQTFFKQILGTAMGSAIAPSFANLFVGFLEERYIFPSPLYIAHVKYWGRYIDDVITVWHGDRASLDMFIEHINSVFPTITFNPEISENYVTFLDVAISKADDGTITTGLYTKPTDRNTLLRVNTKPDTRKAQLQRMFEKFRTQGYPEDLLIKTQSRAEQIWLGEEKSRTPKVERVPFMVTYNQAAPTIERVMNKYSTILTSDKTLCPVVKIPPMKVYKRSRNLRDSLVRADPVEKYRKPPVKISSRTGCFRCNSCNVCNSLILGSEFSHPHTGRRYKIRGTYSCLTDYCVYLLKCPCGLLYIGKTIGPFKKRFQQHRSDVRISIKKHQDGETLDYDKPVAIHFVRHKHQTSELRGMVIEQVERPHRGGDRHLRLLQRETYWIHELDTVQPRDGPSSPPTVQPQTPAFVKLISLQNANGCWNLTPELSDILGVSEADIKAKTPDQSVDESVWATVLAVIWLHASCLDQREEWELLEGKAVFWVKSRAASTLGKLVKAGNKLLETSVDPKAFGL
ncbi:uncharacterized protein PAF06_019410 [Gastrophryne carolinensis]